MDSGALQRLKDQIREKVNLVEVVSEHVVLKKSGANYSGLCPFHNERSPSFSVNETKQLFHCFGCKKGGDLIQFVQEIHGLSFMETIEELADRASLALPKEIKSAVEAGENPEQARLRQEQREKLATAYKLNRFAAKFFRDTLAAQAHLLDYFGARGFRLQGSSSELSQNFYLGGAPASWDALASHLLAAKAPLPLAAELGLIKPSTKSGARPGGPGYFDLFRNRAMFPIIDLRGKVVGFGGRSVPLPKGAPEVGGDSPKYLNSSESLIFHKSKVAYGLFQAQKHIREKDEIILVEGYFDVIALHQAGFKNAVATCGTALTPDHLQMFKRLARKVIVLFDGDSAGASGTERAMEVGLEQGWVLYGASLPTQKDPDEILMNPLTGELLPEGRKQMESLLAAAQPLLDSRLAEQVKKASQGPEARTQALKQAAAWLCRYSDPVGREVRLQALVKDLGVSRGLVESAMGAPAVAPSARLPAGRPAPPAQLARPQPTSQAPPLQEIRRSAQPARPARSPAPQNQKMSRSERILLSSMVRGQEFQPVFVELTRELGSILPPDLRIHELFDHVPTRELVLFLSKDPTLLARLRESPAESLETLSSAGLPLESPALTQLLSMITEALVSSEPLHSREEIRLALQGRIGRAWARFSQQIKKALGEAEANKDAQLHEKLMKDYLDVQRKMKEFSSFYDEA